jgi:DNA-binding transcriptional MerR regulator
MADPVIPDKLYFQIGEVCRLLDLEPYVLRFWETEFPMLSPAKGANGRRMYRKKDVELAFSIKDLLYHQGFTIPGARKILSSSQSRTVVPAPGKAPKTAPVDPPRRLIRHLRTELQNILTILNRRC